MIASFFFPNMYKFLLLFFILPMNQLRDSLSFEDCYVAQASLDSSTSMHIQAVVSWEKGLSRITKKNWRQDVGRIDMYETADIG